MGDGRKTVTTAGTREKLAQNQPCSSVVVVAETDNTGVITVGGNKVVAALATRRGTPLNAGEVLSVNLANLNLIYIDTTVNGDGVTYTWVA